MLMYPHLRSAAACCAADTAVSVCRHIRATNDADVRLPQRLQECTAASCIAFQASSLLLLLVLGPLICSCTPISKVLLPALLLTLLPCLQAYQDPL